MVGSWSSCGKWKKLCQAITRSNCWCNMYFNC